MITIGLERPKFDVNVGSVLRASHNFGVSLVAIHGRKYKRSSTDTPKAYREIPMIHVEDLHCAVPFDCAPIAVELIDGAQDLRTYQHPRNAFYIFGPEDGTLGKAITDWCKDVVYIPTVHCMNLAATVHVVLYDRFLKESVRNVA